MERPRPRVIAPTAAYAVYGRRYEAGARGLDEAIAEAHAAHERPRCLCWPDGPGIGMYVARLPGTGSTYIVKRMPHTGDQHAPECPSYEPPPDFSGLGQVLGQAISEDPATGETTLKLDFPLSRIPGRGQMPSAEGDGDSVSTSGTRLSLRGLLHYLWDQAQLTRWHPGFAGKRSWATVRHHLLRAAARMVTRGDALLTRLYVPEPFSADEREAISARRAIHWQRAVAVPGKAQQLMLLVGEVKEIAPARFGFKAVIKHVPDQPFAVDEQLYSRLGRRFENELALWAAAGDVHMVIIATFAVSAVGIPALQELSLMPVTRQWIPIDDRASKQLVDTLVTEGRTFIKSLRYNLRQADQTAVALLTDREGPPMELSIRNESSDEEDRGTDPVDREDQHWEWRFRLEPMPALPARTSSRRAA